MYLGLVLLIAVKSQLKQVSRSAFMALPGVLRRLLWHFRWSLVPSQFKNLKQKGLARAFCLR